MLSTDTVSLSPNPLVQALRKPAKELTKADIIGYIEDNHIPMLNLRYVGGDGRLKTLNFAIRSKAHLDRVLTLGERVDGSSLFTFVEATSSDLYVVPRLSTAFLNPFSSIPTLEFLCNFYDVSGAPPGLGATGNPPKSPTFPPGGNRLHTRGTRRTGILPLLPAGPPFPCRAPARLPRIRAILEVGERAYTGPFTPGEHGLRRQIRALRGRQLRVRWTPDDSAGDRIPTR